jgi:CheY-like chemotaxis protein
MIQTPSVTSLPVDLPVALLADSDADTRTLYKTYLERSTCRVDEAEDGREALAKAIARRPHIIITETRLPGIDGFALCELLRRDESTRGIPIVFVTGDALARDVSRAQQSGADAVLIKPCLPEDLAAQIRRCLAQSADLRARGRDLRARVRENISRADAALGKSRETYRRAFASRAFERQNTTEPAVAPPALVCPSCDRPLTYVRSHIGGVSQRHAEQWDYFECGHGCGAFQYRQRTRKLRRV